MTKKFINLFATIITITLFTACSTANITSHQSKQSVWQQSQSQKAIKSLDEELKK